MAGIYLYFLGNNTSAGETMTTSPSALTATISPSGCSHNAYNEYICTDFHLLFKKQFVIKREFMAGNEFADQISYINGTIWYCNSRKRTIDIYNQRGNFKQMVPVKHPMQMIRKAYNGDYITAGRHILITKELRKFSQIFSFSSKIIDLVVHGCRFTAVYAASKGMVELCYINSFYMDLETTAWKSDHKFMVKNACNQIAYYSNHFILASFRKKTLKKVFYFRSFSG